MKMSRWILRTPDFDTSNSKLYKKVEIDSIKYVDNKFIVIDLSEKNIEPKCHSQILLSPIESFKIGCNLICAGILGLKYQNRNGIKPTPLQIKGFDSYVFSIKEILDRKSII